MNGAAHRTATVALSAGILIAGNYANLPLEILAPTTFGCLCGLIVHPDLDQSESHRGPWNFIWKPYGYLVPHRSWISHFPMLSTLIRAAYILSLIYALAWLLEPRIGSISWPSILNIYALMGLMFSDFLHILLDVISTTLKKASKA